MGKEKAHLNCQREYHDPGAPVHLLQPASCQLSWLLLRHQQLHELPAMHALLPSVSSINPSIVLIPLPMSTVMHAVEVLTAGN